MKESEDYVIFENVFSTCVVFFDKHSADIDHVFDRISQNSSYFNCKLISAELARTEYNIQCVKKIFNCRFVVFNGKISNNSNASTHYRRLLDTIILTQNKMNWCGDMSKFIEFNNVDCFIQDKHYWKNIFKILNDTFIFDKKTMNDELILNKFDLLRNYRNYIRVLKKTEWHNWSTVQRYGELVGNWLSEQIQTMYKNVNDGCMNNERFANTKSSREMKLYFKHKHQGCCGFEDRIVKHEEYGRFLIGCNYGH